MVQDFGVLMVFDFICKQEHERVRTCTNEYINKCEISLIVLKKYSKVNNIFKMFLLDRHYFSHPSEQTYPL